MDKETKYFKLRNNMVARLELFERHMRDALATGDMALEDGYITEKENFEALRRITIEFADTLINIGADALDEIVKIECKENDE